MRNTSMKKAFAMSFAIILGMSAMTAPMQAQAAAKVPATCDLVRNTMCGGPASMLQQILNLISFA